MDQPSRSPSIDRKDSYRGKDYEQEDRRDNTYAGGYNKSGSASAGGRSPQRRSPSPVNQNQGNVLYIGNLSRRTTEGDLRDRFEKFGKLEKVDMIKDPFTHECRGFAFVVYVDPRDATDAVDNLDQKEFDGRKIKVEKSKRGGGYQKTPGEYLGQFKSRNRPNSRSPDRRRDFRGGRRSRERFPSRERSPRDNRHYHHRDHRDQRDQRDQREYRDPRDFRDRYHRSRSRSYPRGDRERDFGRRHGDNRGGERPYGDRGGYRERERSFSRDRYRDQHDRNDRYRGGNRDRSRSNGRRY